MIKIAKNKNKNLLDAQKERWDFPELKRVAYEEYQYWDPDMDDIDVVQFVLKVIRERRTQVKDLLENNGIKNMEQYRELMGELNGLDLVRQELSNMLEKQEKLNG